ncbi:YdcF family protein [Leptolyngbya sp. CCY15150]|uniref:YdcF family protein n=1 Tax=Leptolyngbya sp. CCY15150 TaxID=2767772 RepID=UPI00195044CB|nr:YdcF family protein [Leptolyngbya sp. CCY15150]
MFDLLTRALLWLLVGIGLWYLFNNLIPKNYLTWLGGFVLFAAIFLAFRDPNDRIISTVWTILSFPLRPLGLAIVLLVNAAKRKAWKDMAAREASIALAILLICSIPVVPFWLSSQMEASIMAEANPSELIVRRGETPLPVRGIVVLATRITQSSLDPVQPIRYINSDDRIGAPLRQRLDHAAQIYGQVIAIQNPFPRVIVSGQIGGDTEANSIQNFLVSQGVRPRDVTVDRSGATIYRSAVNTNETFGNQSGVVILVAPSLTLRRATATFAKIYRPSDRLVRPIPTDLIQFQPSSGSIPIRVTDLLPSVEALALTTYIIDEYLTSIYYFLRGWAQLDYPLNYANCCGL